MAPPRPLPVWLPSAVVYDFTATLWMHQGEAAWHFVTLPTHVADEIADLTAANQRDFGSVGVEATVGGTTWNTSIFLDAKAKSYVLPVKKAVRSSEDLSEGAELEVTIDVLES